MEADSESVACPLANLPWADIRSKGPKMSFEVVELKDSAIFKDLKIKEALKVKLIRSFEFFNRQFPFYISLDHHRMDIDGLRMRHGEGQFWKTAGYHLAMCNANSTSAWKFESQVNSMDCEEICTTTFSKSLMTSPDVFPRGIPQCYDAVKYISEPWIMFQLPFEPVLFHQWLVAAFFEALAFETEISEFYFFQFPKSCLPAVRKLDLAWKNLNRNLEFGFDWLQRQIEEDQEIIERSFLIDFTDIICEILTTLNFWFTSGPEVIMALKRKCWCNPSNANEKLVRMKKERLPLNERIFVYDLKWWRNADAVGQRKLFGSSETRFGKPKVEIRSTSLNEIKRRANLKRRRQAKARKSKILHFSFNTTLPVKKRCNSSFSKIFGISRNDVMGSLDLIKLGFNRPARVAKVISTSLGRDAKLTSCVMQLKNHLNLMALLNIQSNESGILGTIFLAKCRVALAESVATLANYLSDLLKESPATIYNISTESVTDCELFFIQTFFGAYEDECSYDFELLMLKHADNIEQQRSLKNEQSKKELTRQTELRIQKLVLDSIKLRYDLFTHNVKGDRRAFREWQTGQYLLPCLVASFDAYCAPYSDHSVSYQKHLNLINSLLSNYEAQGFSASSASNVFMDAKSCLGLYLASIDFRSRHFLREHIESATLALNLKLRDWVDPDDHPLTSIVADVLGRNDAKSSVHWTWQIWDFFRRIARVLRQTVKLANAPEEDRKAGVLWLIRTMLDHDIDPEQDQSEIDILCVCIDICLDDPRAQAEGTRPDREELETRVRNEAGFLDSKQVLHLALFLAMQYPRLNRAILFPTGTIPEPNKLSVVEKLLHSCLTDQWELRKFLFSFFKDSFVSNDTATAIPSCYEIALNHIKMSVSNGHRPINIWHFPIQHCRYCGNFLEPRYSLPCRICTEKADFPDQVYYCKEDCYDQSLIQDHWFEHSNHDQFCEDNC